VSAALSLVTGEGARRAEAGWPATLYLTMRDTLTNLVKKTSTSSGAASSGYITPLQLQVRVGAPRCQA
jgi:hypothetical protein